MNLEEKDQQLVDHFKSEASDLFDQKSKGFVSEKAFNEKLTDLQKAAGEVPELKAEIAELKRVAQEQGLKLNENANKEAKNMSFGSKIQKELETRSSELDLIAKGQPMVIKTVGDMTTGNYTTLTVGISDYDSAYGAPARRRVLLQDVVRKRRVSTAYVAWADYANNEGGAASQVGEGVAKSQADFELVEKNKRVETIAAYITTSKQSLADVPMMTDIINTELTELVALKLEDQLLTGAGTSNTLKGIEAYATAFTATAYLVDLVVAPTIYDVIINAQAQVGGANHFATHVIMNPIDIAKMISTSRATDGVYLNPNFAQPSTSGLAGINVGMVNGLQLISTNACASGELYVIDATKSILGMREDFNITIGLNGTDLTKNMVTILGEVRAVHYIKSNDTTAFIWCSNITTAIADLTKP